MNISQTVGKEPSRGFTLIELLACIAIIAILSGILIPVIGRLRNSADNATCVGNMRALGQGLLVFAQENDGKLPLSIQPDPREPEAAISWQIIMMRHLDVPFPRRGDKSIFICPSYRHTYPIDAYRTYALNLTGDSPTQNAPRLVNMTNPSKTAILAETRHESGGAGYVSLSRSVHGGSGKHRLESRHDGLMNMFMADGHIESIAVDDENVEDYLLNVRK